MKVTQSLCWLHNITPDFLNTGTFSAIAAHAKAGICVDALAAQLQDEDARAFVKSWHKLMGVIAFKSAALAKAS